MRTHRPVLVDAMFVGKDLFIWPDKADLGQWMYLKRPWGSCSKRQIFEYWGGNNNRARCMVPSIRTVYDAWVRQVHDPEEWPLGATGERVHVALKFWRTSTFTSGGEALWFFTTSFLKSHPFPHMPEFHLPLDSPMRVKPTLRTVHGGWIDMIHIIPAGVDRWNVGEVSLNRVRHFRKWETMMISRLQRRISLLEWWERLAVWAIGMSGGGLLRERL